jgi:hypothetical protein
VAENAGPMVHVKHFPIRAASAAYPETAFPARPEPRTDRSG